MRSDFSFEMKTENGVTVVSVGGWLDGFSVGDMNSELKKLMDTGHYRLILDFGEVDYVNSASIGAIVGASQRARRHNGDLRIFGMKKDINLVFTIVGASKILEIFDDKQEALDGLS
jgi:anti-sigma B factor antagonist